MAGLLVLLVAANTTQAQTYTILHAFSSTPDGSEPTAGLTMGHAGNLCGTTSQGGGPRNSGVVWEISSL